MWVVHEEDVSVLNNISASFLALPSVAVWWLCHLGGMWRLHSWMTRKMLMSMCVPFYKCPWLCMGMLYGAAMWILAGWCLGDEYSSPKRLILSPTAVCCFYPAMRRSSISCFINVAAGCFLKNMLGMLQVREIIGAVLGTRPKSRSNSMKLWRSRFHALPAVWEDSQCV